MARALAMTTQHQVYIAGYDTSNQAVHHLDSPLPESEIKRKTLDKALQLAGSLQTTLDIEQLISLFSREIDALIPHDSMGYTNDAHDIKLLIGKEGRHSCTYRLVISDESYGELSMSRKKAFSTEELILLEYLLCSLVYPLRNAILYKDAIESAMRDPLTGVLNRTSMDSTLSREVSLAKRHKSELSLLVLDIDHFKTINDKYGHSVGDKVLQNVASKVEDSIRDSDVVFRYGGEEFVVLLNNTDEQGALLLAERIRIAISKAKIKHANKQVKVTVSLGVATLSAEDTANDLFEKSDGAMYAAKQDGRNCVRLSGSKSASTSAVS